MWQTSTYGVVDYCRLADDFTINVYFIKGNTWFKAIFSEKISKSQILFLILSKKFPNILILSHSHLYKAVTKN